MKITRNRWTLSCLIFCTILFGLGIRKRILFSPPFAQDYAPDVLWATLVFLFVLLFWPRLKRENAAACAVLFCFAIETSQLVQTPFLLALRSTSVGGLVLGHGFLWSDIACYLVGIGLGWTLQRILFGDENEDVAKRGGVRAKMKHLHE